MYRPKYLFSLFTSLVIFIVLLNLITNKIILIAEKHSEISQLIKDYNSFKSENLMFQPNETSDKQIFHLDTKKISAATKYRNRTNNAINKLKSWTVFVFNNSSKIYTRHAYLDSRANNEGAMYIRLYAVISGPKLPERGFVSCALKNQLGNHSDRFQKYNQTDVSIYYRPMKQILFENQQTHKVLLSCLVPQGYNVSHVSLQQTGVRNNNTEITYIPIRQIRKTERIPLDWGICVPLSYGYFDDADAVRLVEWVEINLLLGVSEINIYNVSMTASENYIKVLDYYQAKGNIRLNNVPPPIDNYQTDDVYNVSKIADIALLNECMMENMYRYEYILVLDFDEVIVPKTGQMKYDNETLKNMVYGAKGNTFVSYLLQSLLFYLDFPADTTQPKYLSMLRHTLKVVRRIDFVNPKQITNPRLCVFAYLHYCELVNVMDDVYQPAFNLGYVPPDVLVVHHYRKSCDARWRKGVGNEDLILKARCKDAHNTLKGTQGSFHDPQMLAYKDDLIRNVKPILKHLDLIDINVKEVNHYTKSFSDLVKRNF